LTRSRRPPVHSKQHARSGDVILPLSVGSRVVLTTLRAPSGVTRIAAVKADTTVINDISIPIQRTNAKILPRILNGPLTESCEITDFAQDHHDHPRPPDPVLQVGMTFSSETARFLGSLNETFLFDDLYVIGKMSTLRSRDESRREKNGGQGLTNDAPMRSPETIASETPMILYEAGAGV
jgi:hypothetical protein